MWTCHGVSLTYDIIAVDASGVAFQHRFRDAARQRASSSNSTFKQLAPTRGCVTWGATRVDANEAGCPMAIGYNHERTRHGPEI
jgi:hypothetical protein